MTAREQLKKILKGEKPDIFPDIIPINPPFLEVMEKAGIYWPSAHRKADEMAGLAYACNQFTGGSCVNVPFDMAVEAEALGCSVVWKEGKDQIPQVKEPKENPDSLFNFDETILTKGRIPVILKSLEILRIKDGDLPIISFIEGPFTIACITAGTSYMFKAVLKDREKALAILERCADLCSFYADAQIKAGADSIIVLDPHVMSLREKQFEQFIVPGYASFCGKIENPLILHICGDTGRLLDLIGSTGFEAFSFDYPAVSPDTVIEKLSGKMKIIGSIPTISHLLNGTPEEVLSLSLEMIEKGIDLLAPSCFLSPFTPLANVQAMQRAIEIRNAG